MRNLILVAVLATLCTNLSSQISTEFKTLATYPHTILKFTGEVDFDYCFEGTIYFYDATSGKKLQEYSYSGSSLNSYRLPLEEVCPGFDNLAFTIHLRDCSDEKDRIMNTNGIQLLQYSSEQTSYEYAIHIPLDDKSQQLHMQLQTAKEEEDSRLKQEEKALVENEKRNIKVGDLLYICNGGGPCEVIAREVTPTKIKIEFISQCWPENRGRISRWTHIFQGHERWLEKKYIYGKEKVNCYGKKSAIR